MISSRFLFIVLLLVSGLPACGQTGALYLPEDAAPKPPLASTTENPSPTPTNPTP